MIKLKINDFSALDERVLDANNTGAQVMISKIWIRKKRGFMVHTLKMLFSVSISKTVNCSTVIASSNLTDLFA